MIFSKNAENISQSVTLSVTAKVAEMKKAGIDVIGFGVGEPDFNTPKNIQDAAILAMRSGFTKYTSASGIIELKEALVKKFKNDNNLIYNSLYLPEENSAFLIFFNQYLTRMMKLS
jgi:aspartate aminotransferase